MIPIQSQAQNKEFSTDLSIKSRNINSFLSTLKLFVEQWSEKVKVDSLQKDLIPAFLYSCSLRISLLSSNSTGRKKQMKAVKGSSEHTERYLYSLSQHTYTVGMLLTIIQLCLILSDSQQKTGFPLFPRLFSRTFPVI